MKRIIYLLPLLITIAGQGCKEKIKEQKRPQQRIHNKTFNWSITIPESFEKVSDEDWAKLQNKGEDAFEKTYGEKIINHSKTIFVFKSDKLNYIEANYQPFDTAVDGDFMTVYRGVNEMFYTAFMTQLPGTKIDTASTVETIDDLEFLVYKMDIKYPNQMIMHTYMFSRLFDKREFTVNIYYVDIEKGRQLLSAWRNSKFGK